MEPRGSKAKGTAFEKFCANLCDKWYGVPPHTFWRSVASGGWEEFTDVISRNTELTGQPSWIMECKHGKPLNLLADVYNEKSRFLSWWGQLDTQATKFRNKFGYSPFRLLVFRWNFSQVYVSVRPEDFDWSEVVAVIKGASPVVQITLPPVSVICPVVGETRQLRSFLVMPCSTFHVCTTPPKKFFQEYYERATHVENPPH